MWFALHLEIVDYAFQLLMTKYIDGSQRSYSTQACYQASDPEIIVRPTHINTQCHQIMVYLNHSVWLAISRLELRFWRRGFNLASCLIDSILITNGFSFCWDKCSFIENDSRF